MPLFAGDFHNCSQLPIDSDTSKSRTVLNLPQGINVTWSYQQIAETKKVVSNSIEPISFAMNHLGNACPLSLTSWQRNELMTSGLFSQEEMATISWCGASASLSAAPSNDALSKKKKKNRNNLIQLMQLYTKKIYYCRFLDRRQWWKLEPNCGKVYFSV